MTRRLGALLLAAFLADMALYLLMTGAPYRLVALGAGPLALGLLPAARGLPYSLTTVWAGSLTEGGDRLRWARLGLILAAVAAGWLAWAGGIPWVFIALAVVGAMLAFFWPALQATLADRTSERGLATGLALFNIAWSAGKGMGFLVGGVLLAHFGFSTLFIGAAGALVGAAVLVGFLRRPTGSPVVGDDDPGLPEADPADTARFRKAAWIANATAFGAGAVLNLHYPAWLARSGGSETLFGSYLGLIFFSQTLTFALMARFTGWRYRRAPLLLFQLPLVVAVAVLPWLDSHALVLGTAPVIGLGMGVSYFASIFYSVSGAQDRGRNAGMHEALLGFGSLGLPFLAGVAADLSGSLEATYPFTAATVLLAILLQGMILRSQGPKPPPMGYGKQGQDAGLAS